MPRRAAAPRRVAGLALVVLSLAFVACWESGAADPTNEGASTPVEARSISAMLHSGIHSAFELLKDAGWSGYIILIVAFSTWVSLSLPTMPVEVAAGFVYGAAWGCVVGVVGKTVGSCIAFIVARRLGERLGLKIPEALVPYLASLRTRPLMTMLGVRIAPLPLGVKNYGLALCQVGLSPYFWAAFIVNLPFSMVWGSAGASCHSLSEALAFNASQAQGGIMQVVVGRVLPIAAVVALVTGLAWRALGKSRGGCRPPVPGDAKCGKSS